eukprot:TRINITY_DN9722_c0_g1_i1.p1 TRINITY_DN9722_c0_g1~~TRINITY_DN9722_c0_g1_i1.p1  ORF type:complete len:488 (+),score=94.14 TRINITY_DN9722_c0_g1_i1:391-1854(+)
MQSIGGLLNPHIVFNAIIIPFHPGTCQWLCPVLSFVAFAVFIYRRSRPLADTTTNDNTTQLSALTTRCTELVRLVLESGDEFCEDSRITLEQVLSLMTGGDTPPDTPTRSHGCHPVSLDSKMIPGGPLSGSSTGTGAGCGEDDMEGLDATWTVSELFDDHPCGNHDPELDDLTEHFMAPGASCSSVLDDAEDLVVQRLIHEGYLSGLSGQSPPDSTISGASPYLDYPSTTDTPMSSVTSLKRARKGRQSEHCSNFGELAHMSFDAMAQVEVGSGAVLWSNKSFEELTKAVGRGNTVIGLHQLQLNFLQNMPLALHYASATVGAGASAVELHSATQVTGSQGQEVVQWALHRPTVASSVKCEPCASVNIEARSPQTTSVSVHRAQDTRVPHLAFPKAYPKACDYPDPAVRVRKGKRQAVMLWVMYGKKSLLPAGPSAHTQPTIERMYYKCTSQKDCKARLKVDVVQATGQRISTDATGVHNHHLQLVE